MSEHDEHRPAGDGHRDITVTLTINADRIVAALARAAADAARAMDRFANLFVQRPDGSVRRVDDHHPKPLPIDGRAYHLRRRARTRRTR